MHNPEEIPVITPEAAYEEMKVSSPYVVDVRSAESYAGGHIQGAMNLPLALITEQVQKEIPNKDVRILVYCKTGRQAALAVKHLLALGYTNVASFGGVLNWPYGCVSS